MQTYIPRIERLMRPYCTLVSFVQPQYKVESRLAFVQGGECCFEHFFLMFDILNVLSVSIDQLLEFLLLFLESTRRSIRIAPENLRGPYLPWMYMFCIAIIGSQLITSAGSSHGLGTQWRMNPCVEQCCSAQR